MADTELSDDLIMALQDEEVSTKAKANIIRQFLLTQEQKTRLYELGYSIEDLVNRNVARDDIANVMTEFFNPWNKECNVVIFSFQ